ncbi:LysR family transcriptional regulator [Ferrimonas senticii]|uniref:LysR family transcriptional regulator n=1 Tax=Ferrimonas senticii TaxID=394566 RepID=UPI000425CCFD|nr:LysR family transcriptional regulator [Ferrimonas senticii]
MKSLEPLDLNLLQLLAILLEQPNVSAAAKRLHISQSAVSKQLAKLRQQLGQALDDPLFVRHGQGLRATPKALALQPQLQQWLQLSRAMLQPTVFEPLTSQRQLTLVMAEKAFPILLPLLPQLNRQAPHLKLRFLPQSGEQFQQLRRGDIDLLVLARDTDPRSPRNWHQSSLPADLSRQVLYQDHHRVLLRQHHPLLAQPLTKQRFLAATHITINVEGSDLWLMDEVLGSEGKQRRIGAQVPDFHSAAMMAQHSDMIFVCGSQFARHLQNCFGLTSVALPFGLDEICVNMLWSPMLDGDPAHQYLRQFLAEQTPKALIENLG